MDNINVPKWFDALKPSQMDWMRDKFKPWIRLRSSTLNNPIRRSLLLYWFVLSFSLNTVITQSSGFYFTSQNLKLVPFQFLLVCLTASLVPPQCRTPLEIFQVFLVLFLSIPSIAISFNNVLVLEWKVNWITLLYIFLAQISIRLLSLHFGDSELIKDFSFPKNITGLVAFFGTSTIIMSYLFLKFSQEFQISSLANIYSARADFTQSLIGESSFALYALGWFSGVFTPLLLLTAIYLRNYLLILFSTLMGVFIYGLVAQKWVLASFFFVFFLLFLAKLLLTLNFATQVVFNSFSSLVISAIFFQSVTGISNISDLIIRRTLIDPSIMMQYYVKFSLDYPHSWWSDSKIGRLFASKGQQPVSEVIGERYFNIPEYMFLRPRPSANATAGAIADSLAQGGLLAFAVTLLFIFAFFKILDELARRKSTVFVFVACGLSVEILMEGTLHTLAFSRGLFIVPLIFMFLPVVERTRN